MLPTGALIWVSLRPLIRLALTTGAGAVITKADIFPLIAVKGACQVMLNIGYPCLLFSKIVQTFSIDQASILGPLFLVAAIYQVLGILISYFIRSLFWTPHRFRHGILVAGGWNNSGDIPTAVVTSVAASAPFVGKRDQDLAIAYISAFILLSMVTFFPMGGHKWIAQDFAGADIENEEVRARMRARRRSLPQDLASLVRWKPNKRQSSRESSAERAGIENEKGTVECKSNSVNQVQSPSVRPHPDTGAARHVPCCLDCAATVIPTEGAASPLPTDTDCHTCHHHTDKEPHVTFAGSLTSSPPCAASPDPRTPTKSQAKAMRLFKEFMSGLLYPPSLSILIAFPISLINPVKSLFVPVESVHMPTAPDGQPPLAFIMDTASFIGGLAIPLSLICLGSTLSRLSVPSLNLCVRANRERWASFPLGSIAALALWKTIILPVLGVGICLVLRNAGVIPEDDKLVMFICIFYSSLPTATTQVLVTQVYSGTGEAEHLSAYLIPQYVLMFPVMVGLTAYTLQLIS